MLLKSVLYAIYSKLNGDVNDLSKLVRSQLNKDRDKTLIHERCLNCFDSQEKLDRHPDHCKVFNNCKISF